MSVSLALLKEEDREKADLDLKKYWSDGISPGDWKEITRRCSKVFAGYKDVPLALAVQKLKIGAEQKGFGRDAIELIRAKNAFKHDRGPSGLEEIMGASDEAQEMLRRCMEALGFFADYPIRRENSDRNGKLYGDDLLLDVGENHASLWPFIVPSTCVQCGAEETYFIDAWDTKKGMAHLKSFERGHTTSSEEVSDALAEWLGDAS